MSSSIPMPIQRASTLVVAMSLVLAALVPLAAPAPTSAASATLTISQVYGGGGNSGATYTHDFIELFNLTDAPIDLSGLSLQYASATGTGNFGSSPTQVTELSGTIPAYGYFLVQQAPGSGGTTALPTPDLIDSDPIAMGGTAGKVALVTGTDTLGCNGGSAPCSADQLARIVDLVGWGNANFYEGTNPAPATTNPTSVQRVGAGCQDTDENGVDFTVATAAPRHSASAPQPCDADQTTNPSGTGSADPATVLPGGSTVLSVVVTPGTNPDSTDLAVAADLTAIGGSPDQAFTSSDGVTFTYEATVPSSNPPGPVSIPASISDAEGRGGSTTINFTVGSSAGGSVVIAEIYGGGGNSGATYSHDYVELYNRTADVISLSGWSVQYASATGSNWGIAALSGSIQPGGHFLVQLASNNTTVGDPLPPPDATGNLNLSGTNGKVALSTGTAPMVGTCPSSSEYVDFVGFGSSANCFEGTGPTGTLSSTTAAIRLQGGAQDTNDNAADFAVGAPDPDSGSGSTPPQSCEDPATLISAVQGDGMTSPMVGQTVTVQAIVVGDFQNNDQPDDGHLNGFYIQEEDADADGNDATSEGLFVFGGPDVSVGQQVRVTGRVVEFGSSGSLLTELTNVDVLVCATDVPLPAATPVTLPVGDVTDFERYEGMLVTFPQTLTISEYFNFDRFGEVVLTVDRDHQPTAIYEPGSAEAVALAEENRLNRITLDDGISTSNPEFTRHPNGEEFTLTHRFRGGDTLANVTGVMDDSFGLYKVQPTEGADYTAVNLRPGAHDDVGGTLTVASFNVLNYFTTLTSAGNVCGPAANQGCRGADTLEELERQQTKIVAALAAINADVVGLIEIENHPGDVPTATLVDALNAELGAGTYDYIATGGIGTDVIRVAFIYKPASVTPLGDAAILDSSVDARFNDDHNRPVLAQAFEENASGGVVTVAVNHLKSKGSGCGPGDDDPVQGSCNLTRARAAEALVDWLAGDPTGSGDLDALIIGDLNAYDKEDPIAEVLEGADDVLGTNDDFTDLVFTYAGEYAYSYVFDGQLGYLDHALASATLTSQVTGATIWHINADEPDILDYDMSFKKDPQDALYEPNPYRSSDHDPVIVGLDLTAFGFGGLEPPIGEENTARAGSTVAVKFSLAEDVEVGSVLFESAQVFDCGDWPLGASVDAEAAGRTGFRYDPVADQYVFNWKTDPEWAGACKLLVVTLSDGTYVSAEFEFRS